MEGNDSLSIAEIAPTSILVPKVDDSDVLVEVEEFKEGDYGFEEGEAEQYEYGEEMHDQHM